MTKGLYIFARLPIVDQLLHYVKVTFEIVLCVNTVNVVKRNTLI